MLRIKKNEEKLTTEQLMEYHDSKSILAKIIAGEDLELVHDSNAKTAYIDLEARRVCIPMWNNMTPSVYDLFLAHEVSHALHTPAEGYHGNGEYPAGFRTFLNVTEDSRIERLIIQRYPGLRALFSRAYGTLHDEDFFGLENGKPMQDRLFIDRLNLHTKLNSMNQQIFIEFNETEQEFVDRLQTCDTFEEILEITQEIYDYCKKEQEEQRQEEEVSYQNSEDEEGESDDSNTQSEYENEYDFEESEEGEDSYEEDYEEDTQSQSFEESETEQEEYERDEVYSTTSASEQQSMEQFTNSSSNLNIYNVTYDQRLFSEGSGVKHNKLKDYFKEVVPIMEKGVRAMNTLTSKMGQTDRGSEYTPTPKQIAILTGSDLSYYNTFLKENNSIINTMVQGFMRKKSASNYYRNTESKTGVLNMSKLHGYKYNEDLFKKVINNFDGDNYGMVFLLDQSGSMMSQFIDVLEQLLILVEFCRRVQMPYKVVSFTNTDINDVMSVSSDDDLMREKIGQVVMHNDRCDAVLNEFLNSTDKQSDHKKLVNLMLAGLLSTSRYYTRGGKNYVEDGWVDLDPDRYFSRWGSRWLAENKDSIGNQILEDYYRYLKFTMMFSWGGTPLNSSLLFMRGIIQDFKKSTNVERVTFVALTDGGNTSPIGINKVVADESSEKGYRTETFDTGRYGWDSSKRLVLNLKIDNETHKVECRHLYGYDQYELLMPFFDIPWLNTVRIHLVFRDVTSGAFNKAFRRDNDLNREMTHAEKKMRCVIMKKGEGRKTLFDKEVFVYGIKENELGATLDPSKKVTKASLGKVLNSLNLKSNRKKMLANSYIDTITL